MNRRKILVMLICAMCVNISASVYATDTSDLENKISNNKEQIEQLEQNKEGVKSEINTIEGELQGIFDSMTSKTDEINQTSQKIDSYNSQISELEEKISSIESSIVESENDISMKEEEISVKEEELEANMEIFRKRMRSYYMNNTGSIKILEVLTESNTLTDFLNRVFMLGKIIEYDKDITNTIKTAQSSLNEERQALMDKQSELEIKKSSVASEKGNLEQVQATIVSEKTALENQYAELSGLENDKQSKMSNLEAKNESINDEIHSLTSTNAQLQSDLSALLDKINAESQNNSNNSNGSSSGDNSSDNNSGGGGNTSTTSGFICPTNGIKTSGFEYRIDPVTGAYSAMHTGVDIANSKGTPIVAAKSGTVALASPYGGFGNCVIIDHGNGVQTLYGHNESLAVSAGQYVNQGQVIAYMGSTGWSTGPHCHFEIRINGSPVDPEGYISIQ